MLRALTASLGAAVWLWAACFLAASAQADTREATKTLFDTLRVDEILQAMRDEGIAYARELGDDMLDGGASDSWMQRADLIYNTGAMNDVVVKNFVPEISPEHISAAQSFFESELGARIVSLEASARAAMTNPDVEEIARETYLEVEDSDDPKLAAIERFVDANDLMERNVTGAMGSTYRFYVGLVDAGGFDMTEQEILADVWSQEPELRADTETWLYGYLLMAYQPLSIEELDAYTTFSETPEGQALNGALFEGFDAMYVALSYALGLGIGNAMSGSDI